jgi:hypothetical protein
MLNFQFSPHNDMLEANVPEGYYTISGYGPEGEQKFQVSGYIDGKLLDGQLYQDIVSAIQGANEDYKKRKEQG